MGKGQTNRDCRLRQRAADSYQLSDAVVGDVVIETNGDNTAELISQPLAAEVISSPMRRGCALLLLMTTQVVTLISEGGTLREGLFSGRFCQADDSQSFSPSLAH